MYGAGSTVGETNGFTVPADERILLASLVVPRNTVEAGISRAILRGDATELRLLLSEARGTAAISADDVLIAQRALSAIESIGAQDAALLAGRYGVNFTNTINHAFGRAAHNLAPVVKEFGSAARAFVEAQRAVDAAYAATGTFPSVIRLGAYNVRVSGAVSEGVAYIRTLFIP
jgi:hypothetical protein